MAAYAPAQTRAQARAHAARGRVLLRERRGPEAARELETALALDAGDARAQSDLAYAYALTGRFDDATAAQQAALKLDPRLAAAHGLGLLDARRGTPRPLGAASRLCAAPAAQLCGVAGPSADGRPRQALNALRDACPAATGRWYRRWS